MSLEPANFQPEMEGKFTELEDGGETSLENFQKKLMDTPSTSQDFLPVSLVASADETGNANSGSKDNVNPLDEYVPILIENPEEEEEKLTDKERDRRKDLKKIREIKMYGCGCSLKCDEQFSEELILNYIQDIREMERAHRDMIIMNCISEVGDNFATKKGKKRQRQTYCYTLEGKRVCRAIFMLVFDLGKKRLKNLKHHFAEFGVVPRIHGNFGKKPVNALHNDDIKSALQFILNFVDEFGVPQPGAPGLSDLPPPTYLPSDCSRKKIHDKYIICCSLANIREVKYSSFGNVWRTLTPYLRVCNNKEEMCVVCEDLKKTIKESSGEYKQESEEELQQHVGLAQKSGELYNACIEEARKTHEAGAFEKYVHYTFGFCKNVSLPHRSSQIGPVYFTALRKIHMFGFRIDGWQQQLTFLIDENETIGPDGSEANGPNAIISMIDWALERYSSDEKKCSFHGDNSLDQNKMWYFLAYFMWRVMTMKNEQIELMMQIPGHVNSLVENSFGSIKQMYRSSDCEVVEQLESLVTSASPASEVIRYPAWKWRDWETFLQPVFKEIQDTRQYSYFRFSSAEPGIVTVRSGKDEEGKINILLKEDYHLGIKIPAELKPAGLSHDRMAYLYNKVRPFVHPSFQDRLCPEPPAQET